MPAVAATTDTPILERAAFYAMLGFIAAVQISIAAAQVLLALTAVLWIALVVSGRERIGVPTFFWPLAAYAAWTLVSAARSVDPPTSLHDSKQLVLFAIVPIAYRLLRGERSLTAADVVISVAALSAAVGIIQFGILKWDDLGQRPRGMLGLGMTYSGQLMLVACVATARVLFWPRDRTWPLLVLPALIVALVTSMTRNAWVGACAGIGLLLLFRDFRLVGVLPVIAAVLIAAAPPQVTDRIWSMVQVEDARRQTSTTEASVHSNRDRIAMLRAGLHMVEDHPLTGVGPDMVMKFYPVYRDSRAVNQLNPHLHNVPMQIAAERGIPALILWLTFVVMLVRGYFHPHRTAAWNFLSSAALACVAAMLAAGMFEYNFGDSEFLMLFLLLVTLPYAAARGDEPARQTA